MRNFKILVGAALLIFGAQVLTKAIQPVGINQTQQVNEQTAVQLEKTPGPGGALYFDKFEKLTRRYENDFRQCVPMHFNQYLDLFGLKFTFNADINGWNNDKCEYRVLARVDAIGNDIREVFNIKATDEKISQFAPRIECNFNKEQLNTLVDAVISYNKQLAKNSAKMLENPEKRLKSISKKREYTPEEEKLMLMLTTENVCSIPNKEELMKMIDEMTKNPSNL